MLGTGHRAGFLFTLRRYRYASRVAFILGSGTLIWTGVQMLMTDLYWLQGLFAALGLVELVLGRRMV